MDKKKRILLSCLLFVVSILLSGVISHSITSASSNKPHIKEVISPKGSNHTESTTIKNSETKTFTSHTSNILSTISDRVTPSPTKISPQSNTPNSSQSNNDSSSSQNSNQVATPTLDPISESNNLPSKQPESQVEVTPTSTPVPSPTTTVTNTTAVVVGGNGASQCNSVDQSLCANNNQNGNSSTVNNNGAYSSNDAVPNTGGDTSITIPAQ